MTDRALEFWCRCPVHLDEVFERFRRVFQVDQFTHDSENIWEWFSGQAQDPLTSFNITRQWREDEIPHEPVRLSLVLREEATSVEEIGNRLAKAMGTDVHTGTVRYVKGTEFAFDVARTFSTSQFITGLSGQ